MILLTFGIIFAILLAVGIFFTGYYSGKTAGYEHAMRMMNHEHLRAKKQKNSGTN